MTESQRLDSVLEAVVRLARRVGSDRTLVLHGGGNVSGKAIGRDHLGRERPILLIKASGADMRTIDASGFAHLYLDDLGTLRERESMTDDEMVAFLMRALAEPSSPRPSIETLLHGFRSERYVCHVHADAICTLTNTERSSEVLAMALGDVPVVEYVRPGFELAKRVASIRGDAVVLSHHGLVTWHDDPQACLARTLELQQKAERFLKERLTRATAAASGEAGLTAPELEKLMLAVRRRLSREGRVVLTLEPHGRRIADRPDVERIAVAGAATADHMLRIRPWSVVARNAADVDTAVNRWEADYQAFVARHEDRLPSGVTRRESIPSVLLVPGVGLIARGGTSRDAAATAEVAMHTHGVAADAIDALGSAMPLPEEDVFDIEYWPLELAKLRPAAPTDFARRIVLVTGAASGIGRETVFALARAGATLAITDRDHEGMDAVMEQLGAAGASAIALVGDITDARFIDRLVRESILAFGGLDGVVSNAGIAVTGRIVELPIDEWARSLEVNATSHFLLARRVLPALEQQGLGASIVFVGSKNAFSPGAGFGAYSVAKAAEVQLARLVAIEAGGFGVRANVVSPDAVFDGSKLWDAGLRSERARSHGVPVAELEKFYVERSILRVEVRPVDVAEAILFCLSDRSSRMTGAVITVDGGVPGAFPR